MSDVAGVAGVGAQRRVMATSSISTNLLTGPWSEPP
jgi:hypothetical protein